MQSLLKECEGRGLLGWFCLRHSFFHREDAMPPVFRPVACPRCGRPFSFGYAVRRAATMPWTGRLVNCGWVGKCRIAEETKAVTSAEE
jgi:hypothetical protein